LLRGVDLGSMVAGLKAVLLGGGAAAKVAAAVAIVSATTVVAADPVVQHQHRSHGSPPARTVVPAQQLRTTRFETGTSALTTMPSAARVVPVRDAKPAKHKVASSSQTSTPASPEVSATTSKRVTLGQQPAAAAPKGHAKPKAPVSATEGAQVKTTRPVSSKAHVTRIPQSHATAKKVGPTPKAPPPEAAPQPSAPPAAHSGAGAAAGADTGKTKDPTG
jgi:hypothetical protein